MRFKIHRAQFPSSHGIFDTLEKSPVLFCFAHLKPVLHENDSIVLKQRLEARTHPQKLLILLVAAKAHHVLDESTVVPAAIENCHFALCGEFLHVSLSVELRFFALSRGWQRHMTEYSRTHSLHDAVNHSTFPCGIATFENHYDLGAGGLYPFLHLDQFGLELAKLSLVFFLL